jgi:DNA-binding NarL/FixJ family response regulator
MDLITSGMTNQQIATAGFISQETVKNHINGVFAELNARNRGAVMTLPYGVARERSASHD